MSGILKVIFKSVIFTVFLIVYNHYITHVIDQTFDLILIAGAAVIGVCSE